MFAWCIERLYNIFIAAEDGWGTAMRHRYLSLEECLFNAFVNEESPPQADRYLWAIDEAISRLGRHAPVWFLKRTRAHKEHECERGCKIQAYDVYYTQGNSFSALKFCTGCAAMILYYMEAHTKEPQGHTHWDPETGTAVDLPGDARGK